MKPVTAAEQLFAQFLAIVDLAIEHKHDVAVITDHGLAAAREIDDFESNGSKTHVFRLVDRLFIGAAMDQRLNGITNVNGWRFPILKCESGNATQIDFLLGTTKD